MRSTSQAAKRLLCLASISRGFPSHVLSVGAPATKRPSCILYHPAGAPSLLPAHIPICSLFVRNMHLNRTSAFVISAHLSVSPARGDSLYFKIRGNVPRGRQLDCSQCSGDQRQGVRLSQHPAGHSGCSKHDWCLMYSESRSCLLVDDFSNPFIATNGVLANQNTACCWRRYHIASSQLLPFLTPIASNLGQTNETKSTSVPQSAFIVSGYMMS